MCLQSPLLCHHARDLTHRREVDEQERDKLGDEGGDQRDEPVAAGGHAVVELEEGPVLLLVALGQDLEQAIGAVDDAVVVRADRAEAHVAAEARRLHRQPGDLVLAVDRAECIWQHALQLPLAPRLRRHVHRAHERALGQARDAEVRAPDVRHLRGGRLRLEVLDREVRRDVKRQHVKARRRQDDDTRASRRLVARIDNLLVVAALARQVRV